MLHPGPVDLNGGAAAAAAAASLNGHHAVTVAAAAAAAAVTSPSSGSAPMDKPPPPPPPPLPPPPSLPARAAEAVAAMKALGKEGKWREALAVLSQLKADAAAEAAAGSGGGGGGSNLDLAPNVTVYNAAISAVSRSGKWDEVRFFLVSCCCRRLLILDGEGGLHSRISIVCGIASAVLWVGFGAWCHLFGCQISFDTCVREDTIQLLLLVLCGL